MPDASTPALDSIATFGALLKTLRRRAGLTQRDLGNAVGYSESQIARLEAGQRFPDLLMVQTEFVQALGIESSSDIATRLISLAAAARGEQIGPAATTAAQPVKQAAPQSRMTNLPIQLTRFIGRARELGEVVRLVNHSRLVTLTGAGGMGKTRLAIEVGAHCAPAAQSAAGAGTVQAATFADGVWLVELAPITDGALVPQAVAAIWDLPEQPGRLHIDALTTFLAEKQTLLILNNCERLIEYCAPLAETLLQTCPQLHILATSREALRIAGEITWRVPPLDTPLPDVARLPSSDQLVDFDAVKLFIEHASMVQADFTVTSENLKLIARICQRLDGMPLAIEMAAVQTADLSVEEIALGLDDRFALLTSGSRTALPHQQTLRATLDWSYELLGQSERILLARLSVFAGGWTAEAARAACTEERSDAGSQGSEIRNQRTDGTAQASDSLTSDFRPLTSDNRLLPSDILPLLLQLVRKSLVATAQHEGQTRYRLLETLRQYAAEKLQEQGRSETLRVRDRHLAYFLGMAEETMDLGGRHVDAWVRRIEPEYDNMCAAFSYAHAGDDRSEMALRLAAALRPFWFKRGYIEEGMAWLDESLQRAPTAPAAMRARALLAKATLFMFDGDLLRGLSVGEAALALFRETDDKVGTAWCLEFFANNLNDTRAQGLAEEALPLFREMGSLDGVGRTLRSLGMSAFRAGDYAQATKFLEESIAVAEKIEDARDISSCLDRLYAVNPRRALELGAQELARARESGNEEYFATILSASGDLLLAEGEYERARQVLQESVPLSQRAGATLNRSNIGLIALGFVELSLGHITQAVECLEHARKLSREVGAIGYSALAEFVLASATIAQGDLALASNYSRECLQQFHKYDYRTAIVCVFVQMADMARRLGLIPRAVRLLAAADAFGYEVRYSNMKLGHVVLRWYHDAQQATVVPALAVARAELGDTAFEAAYVDGQRMSFDQAVAYALAG